MRAGARLVLRIAVRPVPATSCRADGAARGSVDAVAAHVLVVAAAAVGRDRAGMRARACSEGDGSCSSEDGDPPHATTLQRRGWDSNPRALVGLTIFKTVPFDRSGTPPSRRIVAGAS